MDVAWQFISQRLWKFRGGRYGGCFEEDIGLCVGEQDEVIPHGWMYWRSMHQISMVDKAFHNTEEASKIYRWKCQKQKSHQCIRIL